MGSEYVECLPLFIGPLHRYLDSKSLHDHVYILMERISYNTPQSINECHCEWGLESGIWIRERPAGKWLLES